MLGNMEVLFFTFFFETSVLFSAATAPIYVPSNSVQEFSFFTSSPTFLIFFSHSDMCEVIFHCGFDLYFHDR